MRKTTVLFLGLSLLAFAMVGCSGGEEPTTDQPNLSEPEAEVVATDVPATEVPAPTQPTASEAVAEAPAESSAPDTGNGPNFAMAAETLGITEQELKDAMGPPPPDFAAAAQTLGISEDVLKSAMDAAGGGSSQDTSTTSTNSGTGSTVTINSVDFDIAYDLFTWANLPADVSYERQPLESYTNADGVIHSYEAVYVSSRNLNWYQAAYLAQDAGGYLASITSDGENTFVFNLVSDPKYFWSFPEEGEHYGISIGPFLGGYQPEGSSEPAGGWSWLSGEAWNYSNWAKNLDDGVIDKDPRPNDQPNDSGSGQPIMGFGEMNLPVATWGDYMPDVGSYGQARTPGSSYGFVIEYDN